MGCKNLDKKRRKVGMKVLMPKPLPGKASGGCAFDGARISLVPITDAAHIVHGPITCAGNSFETRKAVSSNSSLYLNAFTTDLTNDDIIYGGEEKLKQAIVQIIDNYNPKAVFVYNTCIPAMTGQDIVRVSKEVEDEKGIPVIPVNAPGFIGPKNYGTRIAAKALFDHVIGRMEPEKVTDYDINLIGEFNVAGDLFKFKNLIEECGVRVLSTISGDGRFNEIATAHRAKLNIVFCSQSMINLAEYMEEKYNIPFMQVSFYGMTNTSNALRKIAKFFGPSIEEKAERIIERETRRIEPRVKELRKKLKGRKAVLYTGGNKSWSVIGALKDLGMSALVSSGRKSTAEDREKIKSVLGEKGMIGQLSALQLHKLVLALNADVLIAGGRNMYPSIKSRIPYLHINQERHFAYAGYDGFIEFGNQLVITITTPVWKFIRENIPNWVVEV